MYLVCQQPLCTFRVVIKQSRHRLTKGTWSISHVQGHDSSVCHPVQNPSISPACVATLPAMQVAMSSASVTGPQRIQQEMVFRQHGIIVHPVTMCRATAIVKGLVLKTAAEKMAGLGKLLHAFVDKNPGSVVKVDRDASNCLQRLFIRPGCHSSVLPALLGIVHNDSFHVKTVIFNSNLCATVLLTNQRTTFIYAIGMFPIENEANWTWYMQELNEGPLGLWLQSGRAMIMGDREKGEEAAADTIFPLSPKAACQYHIRKNMETNNVRCKKENRHIWQKVASVASLEERDEWWDLLRHCEPGQFAYLSGINALKWQNSVQIQHGIRTFYTRTNNVAEGVGASMCKIELGLLPIRFRAPYAMIEGVLQLFCSKSQVLREKAEKLMSENIRYSDYALSLYSKEDVESASYTCVKVAVNEWVVRRIGIHISKVRHVKAASISKLQCECLMDEETGIVCRHIIRVAKDDPRFAGILAHPCDDVWHNSTFIDRFKDFQVLMPSDTEVYQCTGEMFPGPFKIPPRVAQRGRPRTKRIKGWGEQQFKRKVRNLTGGGEQDKRRQCSLCKAVGHRKPLCPMRAQFRM